MSGLLFRLAGPLQSWGEHSAFGERDTCRFPTRSGLVGMFAAAEGRRRTDPVDRYAALEITVRIDRPGVPLVDFHTVGGGYPPPLTVPTAEGKHRGPNTGTIVSRRHYLADAAFTVAITAPAESRSVVERVGHALAHPVWPPYLGRRSCPPEAPLLLRTDVAEPVDELRNAIPLDRFRPSAGDIVDVDFVVEPVGADDRARTELNDVPVDFAPRNRRYGSRQVVVETITMPADLCADRDADYLDRMDAYLGGVIA